MSISREYSEASRALIVAYLQERCGNGDLARYVEPRRQFRAPRLRGCDPRVLATLLENVEELSDAVADLEPDGKGVPVLLRQYLNCGGEMLAFNVDQRVFRRGRRPGGGGSDEDEPSASSKNTSEKRVPRGFWSPWYEKTDYVTNVFSAAAVL